jgi:hypothetical protein
MLIVVTGFTLAFAKSCIENEQLRQFGKSSWHPSNFGKTRKIGFQQFGKPTWQK